MLRNWKMAEWLNGWNYKTTPKNAAESHGSRLQYQSLLIFNFPCLPTGRNYQFPNFSKPNNPHAFPQPVLNFRSSPINALRRNNNSLRNAYQIAVGKARAGA